MFEKKLIIFDLQGTLLQDTTFYDRELLLFPGVREMLESLKARDYQLAIATAATRSALEHVLERLNLTHLFDITRSISETKPKPNPLMLQEILNVQQLKVEQALYVGDSVQDFKMGYELHMDVVAVAYGETYYTQDDLDTSHVRYTIDKPEALLNLLKT